MLKFRKSKINNASEGYPHDMKTFKEPNIKKKILYSLIGLIILSLGIVFYKDYCENTIFNITDNNSDGFYFAYYVNGAVTRDIPTKDSGLTLDTEKSTCTSGVTVSWDDDEWHAILDYSNYTANSTTRTKCTLFFKERRYCEKNPNAAICQVLALAENADSSSTDVYTVPDKTSDSCSYTLAYDGTADNNLRYVGSNPCNYVKVDNEIWRIIGLMNNIDDGTGKKETRIKLIRNEAIGKYSWDSSESSVNGGYGVNEWRQADLMKLLNPGYESESVGGSLYYNNSSGNCYYYLENATTSCDFTSSGLKTNLKKLIGNTLWNTGTNGKYNCKFAINGLASHFYSYERSSNNGKICTSGSYCKDTVTRTTTWNGKVGLMYPSDYGYATSGGSTSNRTSCLNKELIGWDSSSYSDCKNNDWLFDSNNLQWTLSPNANSSDASNAFNVRSTGYVGYDSVGVADLVRPSVYLISKKTILGGEGTLENPYEIG